MNHKNFTTRTDWFLTAIPLQRKLIHQPKTDLRNLPKTPNIINFQRVVGRGAIDNDVLYFERSLPGMIHLSGLPGIIFSEVLL